jgi:hypothetical protein
MNNNAQAEYILHRLLIISPCNEGSLRLKEYGNAKEINKRDNAEVERSVMLTVSVAGTVRRYRTKAVGV